MIAFTKYLCVLAGSVLLIDRVLAEYDTRDGEFNLARTQEESNGVCVGSNCAKRTVNGASGAMWFGPRLGRRRRSESDKSEIDSDKINAIVDVLNGAPWALVSIPGGKRHAMPVFTPRLGRELAEEYLQMNSGASGGGDGRGSGSQNEDPRLPFYVPRLGRRLPFEPRPRVGRQLRDLLGKV